MLRFIGITGGVGAGKSEVLKYIREHYPCEIYLADEVAHLVKEPGTECYRALVELLGEDIVAENGQIDRTVMAEKIFADAKVLAQVNAIIHPAVKEYILERYEQAKIRGEIRYFFVEAALLIEGGYKELADELWYIYADRDTRSRRLEQNRGYGKERIENTMARQLSEEEFRRECDVVIDNSGELEDTFRQVDEKLAAWQDI